MLLFVTWGAQALAIPAFARKTGLACSACHEVWPRLNDFGQLFRDNGYRLKRDRDAPMPSFADNLKPNDARDLVHYLRSLGSR